MDKIVTVTLDFQAGEEHKPERHAIKVKEGDNLVADLRAAFQIPPEYELFRLAGGRRITEACKDEDIIYVQKGSTFLARREEVKK